MSINRSLGVLSSTTTSSLITHRTPSQNVLEILIGRDFSYTLIRPLHQFGLYVMVILGMLFCPFFLFDCPLCDHAETRLDMVLFNE